MTTPEPAVPVAPTAAHFSAMPTTPPLQPNQFGVQAYKEQRLSQMFARTLRTTSLGSLANFPPAA